MARRGAWIFHTGSLLALRPRMVTCWSALPDLNRSPVKRSRFSHRRRYLHSVWKIFVKEKNGTVKQLLTLLSDVKQ